MKKILCTLVLSLWTGLGLSYAGIPAASSNVAEITQITEPSVASQHQTSRENNFTNIDQGETESHEAPVWMVIPFIALLLMIATGPLFYEQFWHHHYPKVAVSLAALVVGYYLLVIHNIHAPVHALAEYVQFIALIASLYIASGGIMIQIDRAGTPKANLALLLIGAVISNLIGTTGASMLLIRPYIRLNKGRIKPYHIIFFIFMVSNIGGALTPIGDPPLFLGFLKGVPFFWTATHNLLPWILALSLLGGIFYLFDNKNKEKCKSTETTGKISFTGAKNFGWLLLIIVSVFIDPNVFDWVPGIEYSGTKISFVRELIMFSVAFLSYRFADKKAIKDNEFNFEPIREVAFIFIGIFGTMMPALELVGSFAASPAGASLINHNSLYWGTGALSGFLDNAPTYLNFLAASMASQGGTVSSIESVKAFAAEQAPFVDSVLELTAISVAAVFFGAITYIGNGPNFMVKSISEQSGIKMPFFFAYILKYSLPILLPVLLLIWVVFFAFA
ncbi:MAG: sodium:proton antiporter [Cytophagales bacterium]|nr:sodium:proton antiporter [Cytophagales bacterium]